MSHCGHPSIDLLDIVFQWELVLGGAAIVAFLVVLVIALIRDLMN